MKHKNIKVTTTSGFDKISIVEYFEPVTAHLVVGMNFFKDFMSGFTDFFGGKSESYQKTLESINSQVINQLRDKAHSIGANCIIGLKIDNDEISAQGKSMLMVTAIGTPAKANFEDYKVKESIERDILGYDYYKVIEKKLMYLESAKNKSLQIDSAFWDFVKKYQITELAEPILLKYQRETEELVNTANWDKEVSEYFSGMEANFSKEIIYEKLKRVDVDIKFKKKLSNLINSNNLLDFQCVLALIKSSDFQTSKLALYLLTSEKQTYTSNDLNLVKEIINELPRTFAIRGILTTKKKALSSKEKEIWICECSRENDLTTEHCSKCGNDIHGFSSNEINLAETESKLQNIRKILSEALN
jgi:uncharacterized protein YbjQ (UPF0145 family)